MFLHSKSCQRLSYFLFSSFGHNIKFLKDVFFTVLSLPTPPCSTMAAFDSLSIAILIDDVVSNTWSFSSHHATYKDFVLSAALFLFWFLWCFLTFLRDLVFHQTHAKWMMASVIAVRTHGRASWSLQVNASWSTTLGTVLVHASGPR